MKLLPRSVWWWWLACGIILWSPLLADAQLSDIEAFLNVTFNNLAAKNVNVTGINITQLAINLAALASSNVQFYGAVLNSALQTVVSSDVTVQQCPVGTYSNAQACVPCPAGTFSTQPRASSVATCQACPPGTYSTVLGAFNASTCVVCPANTYSSASAVSALSGCLACPANAVSIAGSTTSAACGCLPSYYQANPSTCALCPAGFYCNGGVNNSCFAITTSQPGSSSPMQCLCTAGYYGIPYLGIQCQQCLSTYYCPGNTFDLPTSCPSNSYSLAGATSLSDCGCQQGYQQLPYSNVERDFVVPTTPCVCNNDNPCSTSAGCVGCGQGAACGTACTGVPCSPTTKTLTCPQGYLQVYSPTYYPNSQTQVWVIAPATPAVSVTISFTSFCTEQTNDYVQISQCLNAACTGYVNLATYSGCTAGFVSSAITGGSTLVSLPASQTSATGYMRVLWFASTTNNNLGWQATYSSNVFCVPLQLTMISPVYANVTTNYVVVWANDYVSFSATNGLSLLIEDSNNNLVQSANQLWHPQTTGVYSLVDSLYPKRFLPVIVSPIAPTTWNIFLDISPDLTYYVMSLDFVGTNNPTLYVTQGDIVSLTRTTAGSLVVLCTTVAVGCVQIPNVIGQGTVHLTWNTSAQPAGTYYYAMASSPTTVHGQIVVTPRPGGLTCQECSSDQYCYNGNPVLCPANSQSPPGSTSASSCACNPGYYTATTDLVAYASSQTVDSGGRHSCVISASGSLYCWGANEKGQLGIGSVNTPVATPTLVNLGNNNVTSISLGDDFTCAVLQTGRVRCWGGSAYGQLGQSTTIPSGTTPPSLLPDTDLDDGGYTTSQLSCADYSCCAILSTSSTGTGMRCWGQGGQGQLGQPLVLSSTMNVGTGLSTDLSQMGSGAKGIPFVAFGNGHAVQVTMGGSHACATMDSGSVMCWGSNTYGQVGAGISTSVVWTPTVASLNGAAKTVSCYSGVCCAVLATTLSVKCWGNGANGRLGSGFFSIGSTPDSMGANLPTVEIGPAAYALEINVGGSQTCVLLDTNSVRCWGLVNGMVIGSNPATTMGTFLPTVNLPNQNVAIQISGKESVTCAILADYSVVCWGNNNYKQLGGASAYTRRRSLLQSVAAPLLNISNLSAVKGIPGGAIRSSGAPVTKTCSICPANSFCTGADAGNSISACPSNSLSPPKSASSTACQCANGYQLSSSGYCVPCGGVTYCFGGTVYACPANTQSNLQSTTVANCTCNPGYYPGASAGSCVPCGPGTYRQQPGATVCLQCPAGTSSNVTGLGNLTGCALCPAGTFSVAGSMACTTCQAGYAALPGASACTGCPVGTYALQGSYNCTQCPAGTYNPNGFGVSPVISCLDCLAGTFSTALGANSSKTCQICQAGTFSTANSTVCTQCPANLFSTPGSQVCVACPANSTSPAGAGISQCTCLPGFSSVQAVSPPYFTCAPCASGTWSYAGNSTCTSCPAGTAQPNVMAVGPSACTACAKGYAADVGSAVCSMCGIGTYSLASARNCTSCALGSWAAVGASACTVCVAGTYSSTNPIGAASQCKACPVGFFCPGGSQVTVCPAGSYAIVGSFTAQSQCVACPANYFCPTTYLRSACPAGTSSPQGSTSQLSCSCGAGYACVYNKVVEAVISLNMSLASFQTPEVQEAFIEAVAAAASVQSNKVFLTNFQSAPARRRLLGSWRHDVGVGIKGAERIADLNYHLQSRQLPPCLGHVWIAPHNVVVTRVL